MHNTTSLLLPHAVLPTDLHNGGLFLNKFSTDYECDLIRWPNCTPGQGSCLPGWVRQLLPQVCPSKPFTCFCHLGLVQVFCRNHPRSWPSPFSSTALSDPAFLDASPSLLGTAIIAASRVCTNNFFHDWPFRWTRLISCLHRLLLGCCLLGRYTCKGSLGMASWRGRLLVFKFTTICTGMVSSSWPDSPRSY